MHAIHNIYEALQHSMILALHSLLCLSVYITLVDSRLLLRRDLPILSEVIAYYFKVGHSLNHEMPWHYGFQFYLPV